MRVLFDARPGEVNVTGIGRYTRSVAGALSARVERHQFFPMKRGGMVELNAASRSDEEIRLPSLLEREEIDVYHSPLFQLPAILPCRTIVTIHDAIPAVRPDLTNPGFAGLFEEARESATRADAVVCPSDSAKADIVHHVSVAAEKVFVVPEAPDPIFQSATIEERTRVRQCYGLGDASYVLVVGSLERRKNPVCALEALRILGNRALRVVFVGPDAGVDVESEARRLEVSEHRLGSVPDGDLVALYSDAVALVFPSFYEGFGLPVIEAFACDTPVLASNVASIPEVAGDAACLFDPNDPEALARALKELIDAPDLRQDLVARGRARLRRFTPDRVRDAFANLYTTLEECAA